MDASDIVIVGAGAAGMMAALAARGAVGADGMPRLPGLQAPRVLLVDGATKPGAKILIAGGGRCNVANECATEDDFSTDRPHVLRSILREFSPESVRRFFEGRGCALQAEPFGKLFPRSQRARDVLSTLLSAVEESGAVLWQGHRVTRVEPRESGSGWALTFAGHSGVRARRVIVATGGQSVPETGSRGFGFELARELGLRLEAPHPALSPLLLCQPSPLAGLAGITVPVILSVVPLGTPLERIAGARFRPAARAAGSLVVTHSGVSGPAALDVSGAWEQRSLAGERSELRADFWTLALLDSPLRSAALLAKPPGACLRREETPRPVSAARFAESVVNLLGHVPASLGGVLAQRLPRRLAHALLQNAGLDPTRPVAAMTPGEWRRAYEALVHVLLPVKSTEGYRKAEVTAGGVRLGELSRAALESVSRKNLYFCGEVVNVTGRLGGFNFQWAWSSGFVAGRGAAQGLEGEAGG
ncbi:MAG: aminoacetone oxidase family FAD-binding enzyme [Planctomycetota bacterium]